MNKVRRALLAHFAIAPLSCQVSSTLAQTIDAPKSNAVTPFRSVDVPEDGKRIFVFFDFSCPFCAKYHPNISSWARTVPPGLKVILVPVVNPSDKIRLQEQAIAARCYYTAASMISGSQLTGFTQSVYDSVARGSSLTSQSIWLSACGSARIDPKEFARRIAGNDQATAIRYSSQKVIEYKLKSTPSIAIGGRYVLTPDDVHGDESMFFNILNGLTSRVVTT